MSNGLPDPDSLLTPGGTPFDVVNGVLIGLNHTANGLNGPACILFSMMAIANDRSRYQILIYSLVHPHLLTPKPTVNDKLTFALPSNSTPLCTGNSFTPPSFPSPPPIAEASNLLRQGVSSCRGRMHLEPCSYPPFFGFPRFKV